MSAKSERRLRFDMVPTALAILLALAATVLHFHLWWPIAALLPDTPAAFTTAFAAFADREQYILFPLGTLTVIGTLIVIFQQGAGSWRGRLRVAAVAALVLSSLVTTAAMEPLRQAILGGSGGTTAEVLAGLSRRWNMWQGLNLSLMLAVCAALVTAHRFPVATAGLAGGMTHQHRVLLMLLGGATLFEGYDRFIVSLALPYIGTGLGVSEGNLGYALSLIRIGALLSLIPGRLADRFGRRLILLATIVAYTVATAATGLSRGLVTFVLFQLVATVFLTAELALAQVVIAEEFPAAIRARGQGILGAFAALGAGLAALLFPVFQQTHLGWRGLYFAAIVPLLLIAHLWRRLPETRRWRRLQAAPHQPAAVLADLLRPELRARFMILNLVAAAAVFLAGPAFGFASYRATNSLGWTPSQVSTMMITGGGLGLFGWFVFGRLADTVGRRPVGVAAALGAGLAVTAYYRTSWLLPSFAVLVFMEAGLSIAVNSLGTELFPTQLRATAKAWITNAGIIGAMLGLALVGLASDHIGGTSVLIPMLAIPLYFTAPLLLLLPETRGRELEAIQSNTATAPAAPELEREP